MPIVSCGILFMIEKGVTTTSMRRMHALHGYFFFPAVMSKACSVALAAALSVLLTLFVISSGPAEETVSVEQLMESGRSSYQRGAFTQASQYWVAAARRYEQDGKKREQI